MKKLIFLTVVYLATFNLMQAQNTAWERASKIQKGYNLAAWLEAGWLGENYPDPNAYTADNMQLFSQLGFQTVRVPVLYEWIVDENPPYNEIVGQEPFDLIDNVVIPAADACDMTVILVNHHGKTLTNANYEAEIPRLCGQWKFLTQLYADLPHDRYFFELRNEPHQINNENLRIVQQAIIDTIRTYDTERTLIVGASQWNAPWTLSQTTPYSDDNIIYTFHTYAPFGFTHQGFSWSPQNPVGVTFSESDPEASNLENSLIEVKNWSETHNVPIYWGEFGVSWFADAQSRCNYINFTTTIADELDIPWIYWDIKNANDAFGIFDGNIHQDNVISCFADAMGLEYSEDCNVVTPPEPPTDSCNIFLETFDGTSDSPNSFYYDSNWAIFITERDVQYTLPESIADHGPNCEPPVHFSPSDTHDTTHVVTNFEDAVYVCSDHLMTNINGYGYGLINMIPDHLIDFSEGEAVLSFDISTANQAPGRDWAIFTLQNYEDFDPLMGLEFARAKNTLSLSTVSYNGDVPGIRLTDDNFNAIDLPRISYSSIQTLIDVSKTVRTTFELRVQTNHVKLGMKLPDNQGYHWWVDTDVDVDGNPLNLSWDKALVMLGHHSYHPRKFGGMENTWHWDNISISPAAPFTLIRTDARYADSDNPVLTLDSPAPANAQLVLTAPDIQLIGEQLTVSFDGSKTWNYLTKVINSNYDPANTWGASHSVFKIPIPEGTTELTFTGIDNTWQKWMAKDVYVMSDTPIDCEEECLIAGTPCDDGDANTENDLEDGNCNCAGTSIPPNTCNLITNSTFDTDLDPWYYWNCEPSIDNGAVHINVSNLGTEPWDAGFSHADLLIEQGKTYNITFDAYGTNHDIFVKAGLAVSPFTPYLYEMLSITSDVQTFTLSFTMSEPTTAMGALEFYLGGICGNIVLDNIVFEEVGCTEEACPCAGTPCDDGNPNTENDVEDGNCNCVGEPTCPSAGTPCDDGNPNTENDVEDGNCNCVGTLQPPSTCNLITNGTFDIGLDPWYYWGNESYVDNGTAHIDISNPGINPWDVGFSHADLLIEQGKTYVITFDASGANRDISIKAGLAVYPFDSFHYEAVSISPTVQTFTISFTMSQPTVTMGSLEFYLGGTAGNVVLDNISFEEQSCTGPCPSAETPCDDGNPNTENDVEDGNCNCTGTPMPSDNCNLITNGTFDTNLDPWYYWNCTPFVNNGTADIEVLYSGEPWDVGFSHADLLIEQGKTYVITFDASGTNRDISVKAGLAVSPYTPYHYETVSINPTVQTFTLSFTMSEPTSATGALEFYLGATDSDLVLDNISFEEQNCTGSGNITNESPPFVYPNPVMSSDILNIDFDASKAGQANMEIINFRGEIVSVKNVYLLKGTNRLHYQIADLPTGNYFIRFVGEGWSSDVQKFIKLLH